MHIARGNRVRASTVTGIFTAFADDVTIEDSESTANGEHGVYCSNSGDRPTIRRNRLHDNLRAGLQHQRRSQSGRRRCHPGRAHRAQPHLGNGAGGGSGINLDGVSDSIVRNNLLFEEHANGISPYQGDGGECSRQPRRQQHRVG